MTANLTAEWAADQFEKLAEQVTPLIDHAIANWKAIEELGKTKDQYPEFDQCLAEMHPLCEHLKREASFERQMCLDDPEDRQRHEENVATLGEVLSVWPATLSRVQTKLSPILPYENSIRPEPSPDPDNAEN